MVCLPLLTSELPHQYGPGSVLTGLRLTLITIPGPDPDLLIHVSS